MDPTHTEGFNPLSWTVISSPWGWRCWPTTSALPRGTGCCAGMTGGAIHPMSPVRDTIHPPHPSLSNSLPSPWLSLPAALGLPSHAMTTLKTCPRTPLTQLPAQSITVAPLPVCGHHWHLLISGHCSAMKSQRVTVGWGQALHSSQPRGLYLTVPAPPNPL